MPPKRTQPENNRSSKRQAAAIAFDAQWCIDRGTSISFKTYIEQFEPLDQRAAEQRYESICRKYLSEKALADYKLWTKSVPYVRYWMQRKEVIRLNKLAQGSDHLIDTVNEQRMAALQERAAAGGNNNVKPKEGLPTSSSEERADVGSNSSLLPKDDLPAVEPDMQATHADCALLLVNNENNGSWFFQGHNITQLFERYRNVAQGLISHHSTLPPEDYCNEIAALAHILVLNQDQQSTMAMSIFGKELLDNLTHTLRTDAVDYNIGLPDAVYLEVSKLITALSMNETTADEVILQIMIISAPLPYGQCRLLRGLANMIQKLPDTPAAKNCIKEMALWSTFYDPMLSCLLADPSRKVHLQWVDTIPAEGGQSRPDAVIVEKQQRLFVRSRGYGEAKAEGRSPHDISVDFIRLAVFSKDTIDVHQLDSAIGFQIHGFIITFYLSQLLPSGVNVMFEIARISFPRSLEGLPAFFNLRNVHLLLAINDVFWRLCVVSSNRAAIANRYRSTPSNWQDFVDNRQDSLRMPSLRIDQ